MLENNFKIIKIKKDGVRFKGYCTAMLFSIPWCIALCRVLYGLTEAQFFLTSSNGIHWLPFLILLLLPGPFFLSAWKSNLPVFLYREMALFPEKLLLKGRYFFVPDMSYKINYSTLLWYRRFHLWSVTSRYWLYGVQEGQPQKISRLPDFFNPERTAAISKFYKIPIKRYAPQSMTQLFWLEYPKKPRFTWTLQQYLTSLFMLFIIPAAAVFIPVIIFTLISEYQSSTFEELLLIIGLGLIFSVISFFFLQESIKERQFFRIRQILSIKSIVFLPGSLQINYWLGHKKELNLHDLQSITKEEEQLRFHCIKGDLQLPAYPFEVLVKRIEKFYIKGI